MSIEQHPNFHAVKFAVELTRIVMQERRAPYETELIFAFNDCIRGKATQRHANILIEVVEEFRTGIERMLRNYDFQQAADYISVFTVSVSEKLDEVCDA